MHINVPVNTSSQTDTKSVISVLHRSSETNDFDLQAFWNLEHIIIKNPIVEEKKIWISGVKWDDPVPPDITSHWFQLNANLSNLTLF